MDVTGVRPLKAATDVRPPQVLGALGASNRPNASLQIVDAYPDGEGWKVTQAMPFSSARKYSGASFAEGNGDASAWLLGAPDVLLPADDPALTETGHLNKPSCASCSWPGCPASWTHRRPPPEPYPPPWSSWSSGCARTRRTPCGTSRSRTSRPRSSPATTRCRLARWPGSSGSPGQARPGRAPTARRSGGDGEVTRQGHGVRAGHPAAEAGHGAPRCSRTGTPWR